MHCKKCDAVFHLDASGKPVLGEPPAAKGKGKKQARAADEPLDPIGIVAGYLAKTPKPIWMSLLVLGVGYLLYQIGWFILTSGPVSAEMSANQLLVKAGRAFMEKDADTLKSLATSDSREDIAEAIPVFHEMLGPITAKPEEIQLMPGSIPEGDEGCVSISLVLPSTDVDPATAARVPPLDLCFIKGGGRTYLNGKATLERIKQSAELYKKPGPDAKK